MKNVGKNIAKNITEPPEVYIITPFSYRGWSFSENVGATKWHIDWMFR